MTPHMRTFGSAVRSTPRRGPAFGVTDTDADDFYDIVVSSEEEDEQSDAEPEPPNPPTDSVSQVATLLSTSLSVSRSVLTHVGSISYAEDDVNAHAQPEKRPEPIMNEEFKLSTTELQQHSTRRSALEAALDAVAFQSNGSNLSMCEAPFRFARHHGKPVTSPAPSDITQPTATNAPQQSEQDKRKPSLQIDEESSDDDELTVEPDPLYDDARDDVDEKWVQSNLRGTNTRTDATLCCPCCFVTVCMDCERHTKYQNQYRARLAINCRVRKDEILTYVTKTTAATTQDRKLSAMTRRQASGRGGLPLGPDEYFGVACSDCGTTVAVYDARQHYHFFNGLPSS